MPLLAQQSFLAANLESLGKRNSDLVERLADVQPVEGLEFSASGQEVLSATLDGKHLCSRHRPLDEAERLVEAVDLLEHAVVVVYGFGLGYHVQKLAERAHGASVIVVYEPDLPLLKAVLEHIDHSLWLRDSLVVFITDAHDRAALAGKLQGAESILAQGVEFFEHPASRARLGAQTGQFARTFAEFISVARTTMVTTLMRSVETARNLMANLDHYACGPGIADLHNAALGCAAVIVSAGPSLHKNIAQLAQPGVRDRCVIIAVQTTLKPLLDAGVTPHFVTALDYHEISRRFYEDLDAEQLRDVTLIAEAKAHPVILDIYPGPVRCCGNGFLDKVLGPATREMGTLTAGATVAHLALYVAKYLGCTSIALIGQDLGFTDGLYYAPNAVIHDVWAPELNPFNTIAMMEWQRIVRHRAHLKKVTDVFGKSIYTDAQMHAYLQQFERDFAECKREGILIIDATEGGVAKQHSTTMPLASFLQQHATRRVPPIDIPAKHSEANRRKAVKQRLAQVRIDTRELKRISEKTAALLREMLDQQQDQPKMAAHFERIEHHRKEVERRFEAFELLNCLNQLGVFRRMKADRQLHMQHNLDALTRQRAQLQRDLENVVWLAEAAQEMIDLLIDAERLLAGDAPVSRPKPATGAVDLDGKSPAPKPSRIAALIAIDTLRNGLGTERSLAEKFGARTVLQATLERLGRCQSLESIILIAPREFDVEALIDRARIGRPVEIERCEDSPFGVEHEAIAAARLFSEPCWRGGIAGMSVYDELLCPQMMSEIMRRRGLTAALLAGPDWPLLDVSLESGCEAVIRRHLENPHLHNLVFTQAPPGLCGCVVSAGLMNELAQRNRLSTIGALLVYQPHAPQHDPIAREANVQIPHAVRRSLIRATFDSPQQRALLSRAFDNGSIDDTDPSALTHAIEAAQAAVVSSLPRQIVLELTSDRLSHGAFVRRLGGPFHRSPMPFPLVQRLFEQLTPTQDIILTLAGAGDPLLHPQFDDIIRLAQDAGIKAVHARTELLCNHATIDRLLASGVDVVSVDLNADRAATYEMMMGVDRFKDVLMNLEYLIQRRRRLTPQPGTAAIALPWVVPYIQRCAETYEDIDTFFDRWQHTLGTAVIEEVPTSADGTDSLTPATTPIRVLERDGLWRMTILSDGSAPLGDLDLTGSNHAGSLHTHSLTELWRTIWTHRNAQGARR